MTGRFTVQCGYAAYHANTVTVEAETLEEALEKAVEAANGSDAWRSLDHCGDTFVDAVCEGADADPWDPDAALPVPSRFTERGEPPLVTVTGPAKPAGGIEVSGGAVRLRFVEAAGTVTAEVSDPPPPPAGTPLVTVSLDDRGKPRVEVERGRARVRILDR